MVKHQNDFVIFITSIVDVAMIFLAVFAFTSIFQPDIVIPKMIRATLPAIAVAVIFGFAIRAYNPARNIPPGSDALKSLLISLVSTSVLMVSFRPDAGFAISALPVITVFAMVLLGRRLLRLVYSLLRSSGYNRIYAMVLEDGDQRVQDFVSRLSEHHQWEVVPVACSRTPGHSAHCDSASTEEMDNLLQNRPSVDMVVSSTAGSNNGRMSFFDSVRNAGIEVYLAGNGVVPETLAGRSMKIHGYPAYVTGVPHCSNSIFKTIIDLLGATVLFLLLSPLMLLIGIAIKVTDPGSPVFCLQERTGMHGRRFTMYKFRTMVPDADRLKEELKEKSTAQAPLFKVPHDPRITPVGRLLRRFGLDELPQLFNVLKGDMSLVGPRPFLVEEEREFDVCERARRLARPGITGLAQIRGGSMLPMKEHIASDVEYINNWDLLLDMSIMLRTVPFILIKGTVR